MNNRLKRALLIGLPWGVVMFLIMEVLIPWKGDGIFESDRLLTGALIWLLGGLAYGFTMTFVNDPKKTDPA